MNYYIMFDTPWDICDKPWLEHELKKIVSEHDKDAHVEHIDIPERLSAILRAGGIVNQLKVHWLNIKQCIQVLRHSKKGDVVISWYIFNGIIFNFLNRLTGNKRYLITMNWLNPTTKKWIAKKIYASVAKNPKVRIGCVDESGGSKWIEKLNLKVNPFIYLPDTYNTSLSFQNPKMPKERYFFTGGQTNRDWGMIVRIAKALPEMKFVCNPGYEADWNQKTGGEKPDNITLTYESKGYYERMGGALSVLLPLATNAVGGNTNVTMSAMMGTLCAVSDYPFLTRYLPNKEKYSASNLDEWVAIAKRIWGYDETQYCTEVEKFQNYLKEEFSPKSNAQKIFDASLELVKANTK